MNDNFANTAEQNKNPFRLFFHIGGGKTGSSSIQTSLGKAKHQLQEKGYDYWGLMLESSPVKLYDWQMASASKMFFDLEKELAQKQMQIALEHSIKTAQQQGIHCAIWSNEWFFERHQHIIPALKAIEAQGIKVDIIAYVRRHDSWAKSAYVQWGIKHKTYEGPLLPFKDYIRRRPVRFANILQPWADAFSNNFILRNFDTVDDVVNDFVTVLDSKLAQSIISCRVNEMPSPEELLLRSLYNNDISGEAHFYDFDRLFQSNKINFNLNLNKWLDELLPNENDLQAIINDSKTDRDAVNVLLHKASQPPLNTEQKSNTSFHINSETLVAVLIQLLICQAKKNRHLQHQLRLLARACGHEDILK